MAPTILQRTASGQYVRHLSRFFSYAVAAISRRSTDASKGVTATPLVSVFALVLSKGGSLSSRAASALSDSIQSSPAALSAVGPLPLSKRQNYILAIPATYKGLNDGPAPGAVVGIVLGSVAGFVLCLYVLLLSIQFATGRSTTVVKEEIITTRRSHTKSRSRRESQHSEHHTIPMSERPPPSRRTSRRETIIVEERIRREPSPLDEVIVEEHESPMTSIIEQEVVEVIEDNTTASSISTAPPPRRSSQKTERVQRESKRSGFRTVDPAEFGGGSGNVRRVSRRSGFD